MTGSDPLPETEIQVSSSPPSGNLTHSAILDIPLDSVVSTADRAQPLVAQGPDLKLKAASASDPSRPGWSKSALLLVSLLLS